MSARTCIICEGATGSREHIFPAALGGRRTNKGIYCGDHNEGYSGLAGIIANQLGIFNALLGVVGDHATEPTLVAMTDVKSGREIQLNNRRTKFKEPQVLSEISEDGKTTTEMSFASQKEIDEWLLKQRAEGFDIRVLSKGHRERFHLGTAHKQITLGGNEEGLRAIGYIAQTFLAHAFPEVARMNELQGIKDYTLRNFGTGLVWWDFEPLAELPPNKFPFGHRVIVGLNSKDNSVYARISLFSTLNFAILLGNVPVDASRAFIADIDPLAKSPPNDIHTWIEEAAKGAVSKPASTSAGLACAVQTGHMQEQISDLMRRIGELERKTAATEIMRRITSAIAASGPPTDKIFANIISDESQRVFQLMEYLAKDLTSRASNPMERGIASFMVEATATDPNTASGLSDKATRSLSIACDALAKHMSAEWENGRLDLDHLEMLIGGGPGAAVVGSALLDDFSSRFPN